MVVLATEEGPSLGALELAGTVAESIELIAISVISIAVVAAIVSSLNARLGADWEQALQAFKRSMARGLLAGLDLLIAADIIKTVTLEATIENATVLALLVLIRTFLSWTLVLEVEDRWPWQSRHVPEDRVAD
jgi:uncharacterized membrane protein